MATDGGAPDADQGELDLHEHGPWPDAESSAWPDRRRAVAHMTTTLQTTLSPKVVEEIAGHLRRLAGDPKWEVRAAVAGALRHLEHPDSEAMAHALAQDPNSFVANAAEQAQARRRRRERSTRPLDEALDELDELQARFGRPAADAAVRAADRQFGLLATEAAHEMLTVVAALKQTLINLRDALAGSRAARKHWDGRVSTALSRARLLQRMIEDTRSFARHHEIDVARVTVSDVVDEACRLVDDLVDDDAVVLRRRIAPGLVVRAPRDRLIQALSSLLKNAVEALGDDGGEIQVTATSTDEDFVRIVITDDGCGMDEYECKLALLPMKTTKREGGHTGIGLPLAHKIIERECRGKLQLQSRIGEGTAVHLTLPTGDAAVTTW